MAHKQAIAQRLYRTLLRLYPRAFRERFGESMRQTFDDLYAEQRRRAAPGLPSFVAWIFLETAIGAARERLRLIREGVMVQTATKTLGVAALLGLLCIMPLAIMEVVNRRGLGEAFPLVLFFVLWLNLFAIGLILLPIALARSDRAAPALLPASTPLNSPRLAAGVGLALALAPGILPLLDSLGWLAIDRLFNGPDPEVAYLPGQIISLALIAFPVAAGITAGRPIVHTLRAKGSLFAHPLNLFLVGGIALLFGLSVIGLIADQWPCFIGVPNCD